MPLHKPKDASGEALDPAKLYTPISPHGRGFTVYNPGVELRGHHEAVRAAPRLWIRVDTSSDERAAALRAYRAAAEAAQPLAPPDLHATRILGKIQPERRRFALKSYHDKSGRIVQEGTVWDANDPFVKANPDLFGPDKAA